MQHRPHYVLTEVERDFIDSSALEPRSGTDVPQFNERDIGEYEALLDLRLADLRGKRVLNIGAGKTGLFDKALARQAAAVISLSPHFASRDPSGEQMRRAYAPLLRHKVARVFGCPLQMPIPLAGSAENIPLADRSMDTILGLYSVPLYTDDFEKMTREILRILADEGEARLFPFNEKSRALLDQTLGRQEGVQLDYREIPEGTDAVYPGEKTYLVIIRNNGV